MYPVISFHLWALYQQTFFWFFLRLTTFQTRDRLPRIQWSAFICERCINGHSTWFPLRLTTSPDARLNAAYPVISFHLWALYKWTFYLVSPVADDISRRGIECRVSCDQLSFVSAVPTDILPGFPFGWRHLQTRGIKCRVSSAAFHLWATPAKDWHFYLVSPVADDISRHGIKCRISSAKLSFVSAVPTDILPGFPSGWRHLQTRDRMSRIQWWVSFVSAVPTDISTWFPLQLTTFQTRDRMPRIQWSAFICERCINGHSTWFPLWLTTSPDTWDRMTRIQWSAFICERCINGTSYLVSPAANDISRRGIVCLVSSAGFHLWAPPAKYGHSYLVSPAADDISRRGIECHVSSAGFPFPSARPQLILQSYRPQRKHTAGTWNIGKNQQNPLVKKYVLSYFLRLSYFPPLGPSFLHNETFPALPNTESIGWGRAESIEWFIEDQALLRSYDSALRPPPAPLSPVSK